MLTVVTQCKCCLPRSIACCKLTFYELVLKGKALLDEVIAPDHHHFFAKQPGCKYRSQPFMERPGKLQHTLVECPERSQEMIWPLAWKTYRHG